MITQIIKSDCGCEFETSPAGQIFRWCPLHKSAPELYEACKLALDVMVAFDTERKVISGLSLRLNDALLKAEGREIE